MKIRMLLLRRLELKLTKKLCLRSLKIQLVNVVLCLQAVKRQTPLQLELSDFDDSG